MPILGGPSFDPGQLQTLSVRAPHVPWVRARTLWLHRVAHELLPEFKKRGHCYPSRLTIEAVMPHPLIEILQGGFMSGTTSNPPRPNIIHALMSPRWANSTSEEVKSFMEQNYSDPDNYEAEIRIRANIPVGIGAAGTLVHELAHACMPPWVGHGPEWAALVRSLGLEGKDNHTAENGGDDGSLASSNAGRECTKMLLPILERVGEYPKAPAEIDLPVEVYIEANGRANSIAMGLLN